MPRHHQLLGLAGINRVRENRGWFLALGILLVVLGVVAIGETFILTVFSMKFLGWLMIFGGAAGAIHAFAMERGWGGFFLDLLTGLLYLVGGILILGNPAASALTLTLLIAMMLIFDGLFRVVAAGTVRYPHWGWMVLHGVISVVMGFLIWRQWPLSGAWVIGLFVGISMISNGWSLVMLSMAVKHLPENAGEAGDGPPPSAPAPSTP